MILHSTIVDCYPHNLLIVNATLASVDFAIAIIAFSQLMRIHTRNQEVGWTRQKALHLLLGSSNLGYFVYFLYTIVTTCQRRYSWSQAFGFILMAWPTIMSLAAFLLLMSFWMDLCHQANDEDEEEEEEDEDNSTQQALLENGKDDPNSSNMDCCWRCCSFHGLNIASRQKAVIVVVLLVFIFMMSFALIIWIGAGKNPIDSSLVARVYVDFSAAAALLLGAGLGFYGLLLLLKLRLVRSEQASYEMWKVSGLALVCVVCFTSSALVAVLTNIPLFYHWDLRKINGLTALTLLSCYYFVGSTLPSAFFLWIIRELPPSAAIERQLTPKVMAFVRYEDTRTDANQRWTTTTLSKNQGGGRVWDRLTPNVKSPGTLISTCSILSREQARFKLHLLCLDRI